MEPHFHFFEFCQQLNNVGQIAWTEKVFVVDEVVFLDVHIFSFGQICFHSPPTIDSSSSALGLKNFSCFQKFDKMRDNGQKRLKFAQLP